MLEEAGQVIIIRPGIVGSTKQENGSKRKESKVRASVQEKGELVKATF